MTAELSSMMDENGGYVLWVNRAFGDLWCGDFIGFVNAWNSIVDDMIDNALYVSVFVGYITNLFPATVPWTWGLNIFVIVLVALMNTWGIDAVSWVSAVLLAVILGPICIEFGYQVEDIHPRAQWFSIPPKSDLDMSVFLSTLLWLYGGWDSLGTLAGEVKDPKTTYIRGIALALVINTCVYVLPIIIGLSVSTDEGDWIVGFFETVATDIAPWLTYWVLAGSIISNFGTYNAGMSATARAMWAMGRTEPKQLPGIFGYTWSRRGTPLFAIFVNSVSMYSLLFLLLCLVLLSLHFSWKSFLNSYSHLVTAFLLKFDFTTLVQCDTFLDCFTLLLEFASFIWLKYKEPNTPRPYEVPGGIIGAWAITIPKLFVIGCAFYFTGNFNSSFVNYFLVLLSSLP
jgi:amino acid transporter